MGQTEHKEQRVSGNGTRQAEQEVQELVAALRHLEEKLNQPTDFQGIASAYQHVRQCSLDLHEPRGGSLDDFDGLFDMLERDEAYPAWRRQALLEAYALFFDDVAKTGDPHALGQLPEPPTSEEMGFRPLPEWLANSNSARKAVVHGVHEEFSCMRSRKWEYDIQRTQHGSDDVFLLQQGGASATSSNALAPAGRRIAYTGSSERYCPGAVDPVSNVIGLFLGRDATCCANGRKENKPKRPPGPPLPVRPPVQESC